MSIRIGIIGAAEICYKAIIYPVSMTPDVQIAGIASSNYERARLFSARYGIPTVYEDYQSVLDDKSIDAVYIPLANNLHCEWIVAAATHKKHILVEKPICLGSAEFQKINDVVRNNKVVLHEGIMTQSHPWQGYIREVVESKLYGRLLAIDTRFSYELMSKIEPNSYRLFPLRGGGVFLDNSPYWIQFLQSCLNINLLNFDASSQFSGPNGIDLKFHAQLYFEEGMHCSFYTSYEDPFEALHTLTFENASLKVLNFFSPAFGHRLVVNISQSGKFKKIVFDPMNYYCNQLNHFKRMIEKRENPEEMTKILERVELIEMLYQFAKSRSI